jgi:hypothetical protein
MIVRLDHTGKFAGLDGKDTVTDTEVEDELENSNRSAQSGSGSSQVLMEEDEDEMQTPIATRTKVELPEVKKTEASTAGVQEVEKEGKKEKAEQVTHKLPTAAEGTKTNSETVAKG